MEQRSMGGPSSSGRRRIEERDGWQCVNRDETDGLEVGHVAGSTDETGACVSGVQILEVRQCRHMAALMNDPQDRGSIVGCRNPCEENDVPFVTDRTQTGGEQAPVASAVRIGHDAFEGTDQAPARTPLFARYINSLRTTHGTRNEAKAPRGPRRRAAPKRMQRLP